MHMLQLVSIKSEFQISETNIKNLSFSIFSAHCPMWPMNFNYSLDKSWNKADRCDEGVRDIFIPLLTKYEGLFDLILSISSPGTHVLMQAFHIVGLYGGHACATRDVCRSNCRVEILLICRQ
ncbi:hypothetical protein C5167_028797 [Papaver somniferum]|nr:hypothetical protein C5167_028797 [Papaver somniferum]